MRYHLVLVVLFIAILPINIGNCDGKLDYDKAFVGGSVYGKVIDLENSINGKKLTPQLIIATIKQEDPNAIFLLIPETRSSQASSLDNPRIVAQVRGPNGPEYFGISTAIEGVTDFEAIVWNNDDSKFEFLLSEKKKDSSKSTHHSDRQKCITCHQGGQPIWAVAPWTETNKSSATQVELLKNKIKKNHLFGQKVQKIVEQSLDESKEKLNLQLEQAPRRRVMNMIGAITSRGNIDAPWDSRFLALQKRARQTFSSDKDEMASLEADISNIMSLPNLPDTVKVLLKSKDNEHKQARKVMEDKLNAVNSLQIRLRNKNIPAELRSFMIDDTMSALEFGLEGRAFLNQITSLPEANYLGLPFSAKGGSRSASFSGNAAYGFDAQVRKSRELLKSRMVCDMFCKQVGKKFKIVDKTMQLQCRQALLKAAMTRPFNRGNFTRQVLPPSGPQLIEGKRASLDVFVETMDKVRGRKNMFEKIWKSNWGMAASSALPDVNPYLINEVNIEGVKTRVKGLALTRVARRRPGQDTVEPIDIEKIEEHLYERGDKQGTFSITFSDIAPEVRGVLSVDDRGRAVTDSEIGEIIHADASYERPKVGMIPVESAIDFLANTSSDCLGFTDTDRDFFEKFTDEQIELALDNSLVNQALDLGNITALREALSNELSAISRHMENGQEICIKRDDNIIPSGVKEIMAAAQVNFEQDVNANTHNPKHRAGMHAFLNQCVKCHNGSFSPTAEEMIKLLKTPNSDFSRNILNRLPGEQRSGRIMPPKSLQRTPEMIADLEKIKAFVMDFSQ